MKIPAFLILLSIPTVVAFRGVLSLSSRWACTALNNNAATVVTGPEGQPAVSYEQDLMLTLKIIMDHEERSTTVTKEQMLQQVSAAAADTFTKDAVDIDISVPYHAAAELAFRKTDESMDFQSFMESFEADAVAEVISKQKQKQGRQPSAPLASKEIDISIPYDAAAQLAYQSSDMGMDYAAFKEKFEADAVAAVIAKQPKKRTESIPTATTGGVDIAVPYDAAAKLAYELSDKSMEYASFKEKFESDAVASVIAKKKGWRLNLYGK